MKTAEILHLSFQSNPVIPRGAAMVDVKLLQHRPGSVREVLVCLEGTIFFLREPKPFDVVKDAIPALHGSLYFVHVVLLICLNIGTFAQCSFAIDWAVTLHKRFDFHNVECWVSFPLVG